MLGLVNTYKIRPSILFGIEDEYTAYCFDEACAYIIKQIEDDNMPVFRNEYKSFKDLYAEALE